MTYNLKNYNLFYEQIFNNKKDFKLYDFNIPDVNKKITQNIITDIKQATIFFFEKNFHYLLNVDKFYLNLTQISADSFKKVIFHTN